MSHSLRPFIKSLSAYHLVGMVEPSQVVVGRNDLVTSVVGLATKKLKIRYAVSKAFWRVILVWCVMGGVRRGGRR